MESKGFPALWSLEEYSFYFDLMFINNYQEQQRYIHKALDNSKVSLNIGHRVHTLVEILMKQTPQPLHHLMEEKMPLINGI